MTERINKYLVYAGSFLFILLNAYLYYKEKYFGILIPVGLVLAWFMLFRLDVILYAAVLVTPLAVNISDYDLGAALSIPSEPLLIGVLMMMVLKWFLDPGYKQLVARHPVTYAIGLYLLWMFVSSCTSELPLISFKFLLSKLWFIVPIFVGGVVLFRQTSNVRKFIWLYSAGLLVVIVYTTYIHSQFGFSEKSGHWVMHPFYNDHTAYGAVLALMLPLVIGIVVNSSAKTFERAAALVMSGIIFGALVLSFSRAAWMSLAFALGVFVLVMLRVKFKWVLLSIASLLLLFFAFKFEILDRLEKNKQDSSANIIEHIQSISNISSDASNLERINRWQSALRMFHERPVMGWGPGTYQFEYAPYQRSREKTIISTNLGDMGNAHSEYIGPLAEQGVPGLIVVLVLMVTVLRSGLLVYRRSTDRNIRVMALSATLGLFSYYLHGVMNNFLDSDKLSVPFWGCFAIIVALDRASKNPVQGIRKDDKVETTENQ